MEFLIDLWLPILVGSIALYICSCISWMALPHHFGDRKKLACETEVMDWVREQSIPPGNYMFPYGETHSEQGTKEFRERYEKGPTGTLNVYAPANMVVNCLKTFLYFVVTVLTIGYITHVACPPAAETTDFMRVFRIAGTIGILTYASSGVLNRIWFVSRQWTEIVDGIAYGLVLGLIMAMLYSYG